MKSITKILWGLVLIAIGVVMSLNILGITDIDIFFDGWWTLFIIVPSIIGILGGNDRYSSLICLLIGVALLLSAQGFISFELLIKLLVPFIIVVIGISILTKGLFGEKVRNKVKSADKEALENIAVVMNDEYRVVTGTFQGAVVDTVFGHCILDLSDAKITESATLKLSSVFSKIDIIAPKGATVKMNSTKVFGSATFVPRENHAKNEKVLYVDATSVFGGIDIK